MIAHPSLEVRAPPEKKRDERVQKALDQTREIHASSVALCAYAPRMRNGRRAGVGHPPHKGVFFDFSLVPRKNISILMFSSHCESPSHPKYVLEDNNVLNTGFC